MSAQAINYDEISKIYDDVRAGDVALINHFLEELAPAPCILDIGCGTGNYTDLFERVTRAQGARVCAIEPSAGMLAKARQKNQRIDFRQSSAEQIPFADANFDFIYMTDVIHHVPDIEAMFREIRRVLKPDGKVCIVTQSHRQIERRPVVQFFPGTARVDKARYPDIDVIRASAEGCGLAWLKEAVLFEDEPVELGSGFLQLARSKGYSMFHLLSEEEYQAGMQQLEAALVNGPLQARAAGETGLWLISK